MNYTFYFLLCLLLATVNVQSQSFYEIYLNELDPPSTQVDSLISLSLLSKKPKDAINIASDFSLKHYKSNTQLSIEFGQKAVQLYDNSINDNNLKARNLFRLGFYYGADGRFEASNAAYQTIIDENLDPTRVGQAYCQKGLNLSETGDFYQSIDFYKKGIRLLEFQKAYPQLKNQYINLSVVYNKLNSNASLSSGRGFLIKLPN